MKFSSYKEWLLEVEARGLMEIDESGYSEDMNSSVHMEAVNKQGDVLGHCDGGPVCETEAVLFDTPEEYTQWMHAV